MSCATFSYTKTLVFLREKYFQNKYEAYTSELIKKQMNSH